MLRSFADLTLERSEACLPFQTNPPSASDASSITCPFNEIPMPWSDNMRIRAASDSRGGPPSRRGACGHQCNRDRRGKADRRFAGRYGFSDKELKGRGALEYTTGAGSRLTLGAERQYRDVGDEQAALPGGCARFSHQRIGRRDGVAV